MRYKEITVNGVNYKQINKTSANKLYSSGGEIFLLPCNVNPNSHWINLMPAKLDILQDRTFDVLVNEFEYYNCCNELGRYSVFFKQI